jgi:hypothetical protein
MKKKCEHPEPAKHFEACLPPQSMTWQYNWVERCSICGEYLKVEPVAKDIELADMDKPEDTT